jgi:hydroxymethylbilane synthase
MRVEQIHTRGDLNTQAPLTQIGSDGVFVTEIERALLEGRIDLAVHSLKDLPTAQPAGLYVAVAGPREDARDVMVSSASGQVSAQDFQDQLSRISEPLRIGTCSLRRTAQIRRLCPDAQILPLRGNVDTRLRKLEAGDYDAIVLAAAGLHRLDLAARLAGRISYFPIDAMMPAPGQGALALEMRDEPAMRALVAPIVDLQSQAATAAERMFMRRLGAGCYLPVAAYGEIANELLALRGLVISLDGRQHVRVQQSIRWTSQASVECAEQLGVSLAEEALEQGANRIIAELARTDAHEPDAHKPDAHKPDAHKPDAHKPDAHEPDAHEGHPYISASLPTHPHDADASAIRGERGGSGYVGMPLVGIRGKGIAGKRMLVTRAGEQAGVLSDRLRALGAVPIEFPMIRIVPPADWQPLDDALRRLCAQGAPAMLPEQPYYAWLLFTSVNGVSYFFERLCALGYDSTALRGTSVAAIGAATQSALGEHGVNADLVPGEYVAEELAMALVEDAEKRGDTLIGKRVLLARAAGGRYALLAGLRQAGAIVEDVAVYQTIPVNGDDETGREVLHLLRAGQLDMLTFTSSSTVRNFVQWLSHNLSDGHDPGRPATLAVALDKVAIACIGPVTSQTARELGLHVQIEAKESTIDGLIEAILRYEER